LLQVETAVEEWNPLIAGLLEKEANKIPQGKGPLGEIEFWREKNATFNTLCEQLSNPSVKKMMEVLEVVDSPTLQAFKSITAELTKQYEEAKVTCCLVGKKIDITLAGQCKIFNYFGETFQKHCSGLAFSDQRHTPFNDERD
jgi:hypothetical protein